MTLEVLMRDATADPCRGITVVVGVIVDWKKALAASDLFVAAFQDGRLAAGPGVFITFAVVFHVVRQAISSRRLAKVRLILGFLRRDFDF